MFRFFLGILVYYGVIEQVICYFLFRSVNETHTYKPTYIHKNIPDYTRETLPLSQNGQQAVQLANYSRPPAAAAADAPAHAFTPATAVATAAATAPAYTAAPTDAPAHATGTANTPAAAAAPAAATTHADAPTHAAAFTTYSRPLDAAATAAAAAAAAAAPSGCRCGYR